MYMRQFLQLLVALAVLLPSVVHASDFTSDGYVVDGTVKTAPETFMPDEVHDNHRKFVTILALAHAHDWLNASGEFNQQDLVNVMKSVSTRSGNDSMLPLLKILPLCPSIATVNVYLVGLSSEASTSAFVTFLGTVTTAR